VSSHLCDRATCCRQNLLRNYLIAKKGISRSTVICNTDDIRSYHPHYESLLADPLKAPNIVNQDAIEWNNNLFDYAIKKKFNLVVDATFGSASFEHYENQFNSLQAEGYYISINAICVHPLISYLSNYMRYISSISRGQRERLISKPLHDISVKNLPLNLFKLAEMTSIVIDEVSAYTRNDFELLPFSGKIDSITELGKIIQTEHSRELSIEEKRKFDSSVIEMNAEIQKFAPSSIAKQFRREFKSYYMKFG
jgi:Zeta toxin